MAPPAIVKQTVAWKGIGKKRRIDETIAFDAEITKTGEISALSVVDESGSEILCMRPDRPSMLEAVAPILKDVFSSADVIIYYGADGSLSPFDITGIGQESNRVVDAMAEFSEARAVPDRCSEFKTCGIEEAAEFIGCEKFGKEHGIEDAYDEFSEKQLNRLKIDDDKEFLRECRPLFCPKCETRMEQKTLEVQFGSSANAMTARSVGCHVCPICGRITFDDDDMRAARGYKETVKLAIDGVAGGSITDYGRRNAENYGARWERYYREGYLERYFARLDEALAEAAERGDVAYIGNRWAHSQAKAEAEGWVRRKTERWCKIAEAIERYASQGRTDEFEKALEEGRADAILSELGLDGAYAYY